MSKFFPYGQHHIDEQDITAVIDVMKADFLTCGPKVEEFEDKFSTYLTSDPRHKLHTTVVNSGTAALHLACLAIGLNENSCAIVPSITFLSTANAVRMTGADVIFADCDPLSGLMTPKTFADAIEKASKPIKAVLPVHLNGNMVNLEGVKNIADANDIKIISDCCHALGAEYFYKGRHQKAGDCGIEDISCFSFHPVKSLAMGEGGAVVTRCPDMAEKMKSLRAHDMQKPESLVADQPWAYEMQELGFNYRASDINCALGISQLSKLPNFVAKRQKLAEHYHLLFRKIGIKNCRPVKMGWESKGGWHIFPILIDFQAIGIDRKGLMQELRDNKIGSQVHYIPVHTQPYYQNLYGPNTLQGADAYYNHCLTIPLYPSMTMDDVNFIFNKLKQLIEQ